MTGRARPRNPRKVAGSEAAFSDQVAGLASFYGFLAYHTHDSRRSAAGFPDWTFLKAPRLIFAELKAENAAARVTVAEAATRPPHLRDRALTNEQARWLEELERLEAALTGVAQTIASVEVYLWRPSDLERIAVILAGTDGNVDAGAAWARDRAPSGVRPVTPLTRHRGTLGELGKP